MDIDKLETHFAEVRSTASKEELNKLKALKENDNTRGQYNYGHDLGQALSRGYRRKQQEAIEDFAKWTGKQINLMATPDSEKIFWHMLWALSRWAFDKGIEKDKIIYMLQRFMSAFIKARRI